MLAAQKAISSPLLEGASVEGARGVIINVTGGPDMSLLEVNEALTIIQESAHEDANIIFGAVVDPTLNNKVKITVIATGFDHVRTDRSTPAAAPMQTPVDMAAYASVRDAGPSTMQPRASLSRRPSLEVPRSVAVGQNGGDMLKGDAGDFDLNLELEVPAFLRRNEG
jgi:cell division protein FtsZ